MIKNRKLTINHRPPCLFPVCILNLNSEGTVSDSNPHLASCCELLELILRKGLLRELHTPTHTLLYTCTSSPVSKHSTNKSRHYTWHTLWEYPYTLQDDFYCSLQIIRMSILTIYNRCLDALNLVYVSHDFMHAMIQCFKLVLYTNINYQRKRFFTYLKCYLDKIVKEKHKVCYFSITEIVFINILKQFFFFFLILVQILVCKQIKVYARDTMFIT